LSVAVQVTSVVPAGNIVPVGSLQVLLLIVAPLVAGVAVSV
jgi:hypothetical protein